MARHDSNLLVRESARMLTTIVVIWMVRAQFQKAFLPSFACGIGLCVGMFAEASTHRNHRGMRA